jgi:ComF family protein
MVNNWLKIHLSRLFPSQCLVCGATANKHSLCADCQNELPANDYACRRCAEPLPEGCIDNLCGRCLKSPPAFDQVFSPYLYQPPLDRLITRFKFQADLGAGHILAKLLYQHIEQNIQHYPQCLVPVPLHKTRLRQRGFNQAHEICRMLGSQLDIPVRNNICHRTRSTSSQSGLNEKHRRKNIRGAFSVASDPAYKHIAIIDDVMTTGNTVNELARVLRKSRVETIQVWSICRAASWK